MLCSPSAYSTVNQLESSKNKIQKNNSIHALVFSSAASVRHFMLPNVERADFSAWPTS